ncbi:MAG: hypothetical protein WKF59_10005 [Chitinophagaceae bacterium]
MLQVAFIRNNPGLVKERLAIRNFNEQGLVEKIILLDDERKKLQYEYDETQAKINVASKEIGQLMAKGNKEEAEKKKAEVASLKSCLQPINTNLAAVEKTLHDELIKLPNLPHNSVPAGKTPEENVVVRNGGSKAELFSGAVPHWDLAKKYDLINFELGNKLTGSGFPVYKNKGAKIAKSVDSIFFRL